MVIASRVLEMMSPRILPLLAVLALPACTDSSTGPITPDTRFTQVAAGDQFTCGLVRDGRVFCWGLGESGQLGDSTLDARAVPGVVASDLRFTQLTAAGSSVCALATDDTPWCWGGNASGQLGVPESFCHPVLLALACSAVPVAAPGTPALTSLAIGPNTTCGVDRGADVWCWGIDLSQAVSRDPLVRFADTASYAAAVVGSYHACGLTHAGALRCWGSDALGAFGDGDAIASFQPTPVPAGVGHAWTMVAAADRHMCGIAEAVGYCWGTAYWGALGVPDSSVTMSPRAVDDTLVLASISTGASHTCAVGAGGELYCWGRDDYGQLGLAAAPPACNTSPPLIPCARRPTPVQNAPTGVVSVSVGGWHTCAVTEGGEAWCWGRGTAGQLGDGTFASRRVPQRVILPENGP